MLDPYFAEHWPWLGPWIDAHFGAIVATYLAIGFVGGLILLKRESSEDPVGTLVMITLCWGLGVLVAPFVILWFLLGYLLKLLGIEPAETTNDRY